MEQTLVMVVAGNRGEYERYVREHQSASKDFRYLSEVDQLRGLRGYQVVFHGSWGKRSDVLEIEHEVHMAHLAGDIV